MYTRTNVHYLAWVDNIPIIAPVCMPTQSLQCHCSYHHVCQPQLQERRTNKPQTTHPPTHPHTHTHTHYPPTCHPHHPPACPHTHHPRTCSHTPTFQSVLQYGGTQPGSDGGAQAHGRAGVDLNEPGSVVTGDHEVCPIQLK